MSDSEEEMECEREELNFAEPMVVNHDDARLHKKVGAEEQKAQSNKNPQVKIKVRNKNGGKNPQLGPRIRDVKKAARGAGQAQQAINKVIGPKEKKTKENVNPNKKGENKPIAPIRDFFEIAQEIRKRDLVLFGESSIAIVVPKKPMMHLSLWNRWIQTRCWDSSMIQRICLLPRLRERIRTWRVPV